MRVITSDDRTLDDFEKIQVIAGKIKATEAIKVVTAGESNGWVKYNGHSIEANKEAELATQIPNVLDKMRLCSWKGEVYSGKAGVFDQEFAQCLNFILTWLGSVQSRANVTGSKMRAVLEWLTSVVENMDMRSDTDWESAKNVIKKF
jgi:hypothetical protein